MSQLDKPAEKSIEYLLSTILRVAAQKQEAQEFIYKADKEIDQLNKVIEQLRGKSVAVPVLLKRER
jgi:peptidoglycan hydrolase CwlO-like protein